MNFGEIAKGMNEIEKRRNQVKKFIEELKGLSIPEQIAKIENMTMYFKFLQRHEKLSRDISSHGNRTIPEVFDYTRVEYADFAKKVKDGIYNLGDIYDYEFFSQMRAYEDSIDYIKGETDNLKYAIKDLFKDIGTTDFKLARLSDIKIISFMRILIDELNACCGPTILTNDMLEELVNFGAINPTTKINDEEIFFVIEKVEQFGYFGAAKFYEENKEQDEDLDCFLQCIGQIYEKSSKNKGSYVTKYFEGVFGKNLNEIFDGDLQKRYIELYGDLFYSVERPKEINYDLYYHFISMFNNEYKIRYAKNLFEKNDINIREYDKILTILGLKLEDVFDDKREVKAARESLLVGDLNNNSESSVIKNDLSYREVRIVLEFLIKNKFSCDPTNCLRKYLEKCKNNIHIKVLCHLGEKHPDQLDGLLEFLIKEKIIDVDYKKKNNKETKRFVYENISSATFMGLVAEDKISSVSKYDFMKVATRTETLLEATSFVQSSLGGFDIVPPIDSSDRQKILARHL